MNAVARDQIRMLAGQGLTSGEVAEAIGAPEPEVKLALAAMGRMSDGDLTADDLRVIRARAVQIARDGDDAVASGMIRFLLERNAPVAPAAVNDPLTSLSRLIEAGNERVRLLHAKYTQPSQVPHSLAGGTGPAEGNGNGETIEVEAEAQEA